MCSDKTCPVGTSSTTVPKTCVGLNPGLRGEIQLLKIFPTFVELARSLPFSQQLSAEPHLKSRIFPKCMPVSVGQFTLVESSGRRAVT